MIGTETDLEIDGTRGRVYVRRRDPDGPPRHIVVLAHGYGEHSGRYAHVLDRLARDGGVVYAPDHLGHGRSEGDRVVVEDVEDMVTDVDRVRLLALEEHPGLPVVLLGHSMGGLLATRYAQRFPDALTGLVLTGPVSGGSPGIFGLLEYDPIPEVPIDPAVLSRDPAVGEAYAADPLVWHGPFKRPTLEAFVASVQAIADGPGFGDLPVLWVHGEDDQLVPLDSTRPVMEKLGGSDVTSRIEPGARHEVLNETTNDAILDDISAFIARVA
ncbi:lysophospholipase [Actinomycetospora sp. NBRC 106375]|uniref:alpha/beta hydrolase n=1 Tax=Actinomycetospora sp. NBRC 106375 TaxID=3032207 RepID=UPI0024A2848E|nr:alpha/beta hydrolase [Actinomycetospora sp. NBRC 106375]GLZ44679.1 lysophospholipase [Actinomycetospora sp. NBRC 106375]